MNKFKQLLAVVLLISSAAPVVAGEKMKTFKKYGKLMAYGFPFNYKDVVAKNEKGEFVTLNASGNDVGQIVNDKDGADLVPMNHKLGRFKTTIMLGFGVRAAAAALIVSGVTFIVKKMKENAQKPTKSFLEEEKNSENNVVEDEDEENTAVTA